MERKKRLLMVCYHFPPSTAVGGIRAAKFAKFLPDFGWEPIILTVPPEANQKAGNNLNPLIANGLDIHRVALWPGLRQIYLRLTGKSGTDISRKESTFIDQKSKARPTPEQGESLLARLRRYIFSIMWLPDDVQGWYPPATRAGLRLIRKGGIDAILSSGPPWTPHWIAYRLSRRSGLPCLIDFRDPWTRNPWKRKFVVSEFSQRAERWMERKVVRQAARIVCNTEPLRKSFLECYPDTPAERFVTITNGYDPQDYQDLDVSPPSGGHGGLTIAYAGNLYGARNPEPLFKALKNLLDQDWPGARDCRIRFIGTRVETQIKGQAEEVGIAGQVEFVPALPRRECLKELARAHVLLLLQPGAQLQVPAKVFEYIQLRRPILVLAGRGATQELIDRMEAGTVIEPENIEGVTKALGRLLDDHRQGVLLNAGQQKEYRELHFSTLTGRLAEVLNAMVDSGSC